MHKINTILKIQNCLHFNQECPTARNATGSEIQVYVKLYFELFCLSFHINGNKLKCTVADTFTSLCSQFPLHMCFCVNVCKSTFSFLACSKTFLCTKISKTSLLLLFIRRNNTPVCRFLSCDKNFNLFFTTE